MSMTSINTIHTTLRPLLTALLLTTAVLAIAQQRPKLPIEYVAERNLEAVTDYNHSGAYYNLSYSKYKMPKDTHMPSIEEWTGVFPMNGALSFYDDDVVEGNYEPVEIAGEMHTFESDYQRNDFICYGLRFKDDDNTYLCAYRYQRMGRWIPKSLESGVEVKVVYLGPSFQGNLETISTEAWWAKNKAKTIRRYFPAPGFRRKDYPGITDSQGTDAYYWSKQPNIVVHITIEGVTSDKLEPVFETVGRPFSNN